MKNGRDGENASNFRLFIPRSEFSIQYSPFHSISFQTDGQARRAAAADFAAGALDVDASTYLRRSNAEAGRFGHGCAWTRHFSK
jgi:hypothetical protein